MSRHVWDKVNNCWVEVPKDYKPPPRKTPWIHTDVQPFVSPVDGTVISSKNALREHNRRNDVVDSREWGNKECCDLDAKRKRENIILGKDKETNDKRKQDLVDACKQHGVIS